MIEWNHGNNGTTFTFDRSARRQCELHTSCHKKTMRVSRFVAGGVTSLLQFFLPFFPYFLRPGRIQILIALTITLIEQLWEVLLVGCCWLAPPPVFPCALHLSTAVVRLTHSLIQSFTQFFSRDRVSIGRDTIETIICSYI